MNAVAHPPISRATSATAKQRPSPRSPLKRAQEVARSVRDRASREAKQWAAAILEVLAGTRTPLDAATAMSVSLPRYYVLEQRALDGLLAACEPKAHGRIRTPEKELALLRQEVERLQRECARRQALVRAAQRTVGLTLPEPTAAKASGKDKRRRKRQPTARALKAAAVLQSEAARPDGDASTSLSSDEVNGDGVPTTKATS